KHGLRSRQKVAVAPHAGVAGGLEPGANTKAFAAHRTAEINSHLRPFWDLPVPPDSGILSAVFHGPFMKPQVEIYDTTLRDGSQGEGINFSVADKLRIAEKLDAFGVHYIEGGWPGSNPKDIEFFAQAKKKKFKNAKLAAFGSTRKKGVPVEQDDQVRLLIEAGTPVVTIYGKTSMLHVKEVLRCTPEENLAMIGDTVKFLKDHGKFVIYDAEHCFD